MADKIRLGLIGANVQSRWATKSHLPAILESPDFELTAVCTTRRESAEEARRTYGAKLAFHDFREMAASPEIDAVAVVVRVPSHYEPTKAALLAGKHVFTEWPLGRTTAEAEELAALAKSKDVHTAVGLQSRVNPALMYMRELVTTGYVGDVMSCQASFTRDGALERIPERIWTQDANLGANTLTIANGHTLDALQFVAGEFSQVAAVVATQAKQWVDTETKQIVDVTSPDNVLVSGRLANGAVASVYVATIPWAHSGYRMEVYGRQGTLVATSDESPQLNEVRLQGAPAGARGSKTLRELKVPPRFVYTSSGAGGWPFNVGQMYYQFAQAIHNKPSHQPTFDTAVKLHRVIDAIKQASDTRREVSID